VVQEGTTGSDDGTELAASGVQYWAIDGAAGMRFFDCQPYRAKLSTTACSQRWRTAQRATGSAAARFEKCRACSIGAIHSGEAVTYFSPLFGKPICTRCRRGSMRRLIGDRLCISCYNRELEFRRGKNAKGNPPEIKLERRTVRYAVEGAGVQTLILDHSADLAELMVTVLRKTRGRVAFGFHGGPLAPQAAAA